VASRWPPECFDRYPPTAALAATAGPGSRADEPVLFLHERQTAAGRRRIVVVRADPTTWLAVRADSIRPAGLRGDPAPDAAAAWAPLFVAAVPSSHRLRVYAGQADPADPSRFTIRYELDGQPGVVRGELVDRLTGGASVVLTPPPPVREPATGQ
jgi:hypothetical protein